MSEERTKRKLSGIFRADAVGYSRLMQEDEASTILLELVMRRICHRVERKKPLRDSYTPLEVFVFEEVI